MMILDDRGRLGRVDSRVKLAWVGATLVAGLVFADPVSLIVILGTIAMVAAAGGVLEHTLSRLSGLGMLIVTIGLIFGLTVPGDPLLVLPLVAFDLIISAQGLHLGLISVLRMFVFAAPLLVVVMTTSNSDLIQGLMAARLPMEYALMLVLALNFVPLYLAEFGRIGDAQRARAHSLIEQGLLGKLRGLGPIFVPLALNAIDRADTVGKVLEIRGFARRRFRPEFEPLNAPSAALLVVSLALVAVVVSSLLAGRDLIAAALQGASKLGAW
jgi:energy-coupling factor transport system permease protein